MKVVMTDSVESAHAYIDKASGKVIYSLIAASNGDELDSEDLGVGDADRALQKLVDLGYAKVSE